MKKRLLAIFLAVCMTLVLLPTAAFADEEASPTWADAVTAAPAGYTIDEILYLPFGVSENCE